MRENIGLFKAKRLDNGEEVQGYYWTNELGNHFIRVVKDKDGNFINAIDFEIDPETLCEFTGLTDKNGKMIWENDIVKASYSIDNYSSLFKTMSVENFVNVNCLVIFDFAEFKLKNPNSLYCKSILGSYNEEIIGNIHDNKNLIGEQNE